MVRPERFELPTSWFVARRSIQLSYGRTCPINRERAGPQILAQAFAYATQLLWLAERGIRTLEGLLTLCCRIGF
jgi:hypothetical protein